jgi:predicted RNA binding protein YcfA (HicA-like mRNA interferase family)
MPRLVSIPPKKLIKILETEGFVLGRISGSHHVFYNIKTGAGATVPVHGRDVPKGTLLAIIRESGISPKLFRK